MTGLSVEHNLIKAKSLVRDKKFLDALGLYNSILKKFPHNKRAQFGIHQLKLSAPKILNPSQQNIDTLIEHYQKGRNDEAVKLAKIMTKEFPENSFGWKLLGAVLQATGEISKSINSFQKYLEITPLDAKIFNNLGVMLLESTRLDEAVVSFKKAISLKYDYPNAYNNLGMTLKKLGKLDESEVSLKKAIELKSDFAEAYCNLGDTQTVLLKLEEAEKNLRQAISLKPNYADAFCNLGIALKQLGRLEEAERSLKKALVFKSNFSEAYNNLAVILKEQGKLEEAESNLKNAIIFKPNYSNAFSNMGVILQELGKLEEAETSLRRAIVLRPGFAEAHNNLCAILIELGRLEEAKTEAKKSIEIKSDFAGAYSNLGITLQEVGRLEEAEVNFKQAITLKPNFAEPHNNLGGLFHSRGLMKKSLDCYLKAISLNPENISYKWDFTINQLSKIYTSYEDYKKSLLRFEEELNKLNQFITTENFNESAKAVGKFYPYYLAYFENDNRFLLEKHGELCHRVMKCWQLEKGIQSSNLITNNDTSMKIKIGIVSAHIFYHSVWNSFLKGIIKELDTEKFEIHIFSLGKIIDSETELAKKKVKYFYSEEGGIFQWANKIINSKIDIAFYPEIGMNQQTIQLASMRLAPTQVCSWGHPETSGLPTMDYYISSDLLETKNSNKFYTEKLIKLSGLGYYYEPPTLESSEINFLEMGINQNLPLLLCLGAPNKFSPFYDWVFIEIIRRLDDCQLVFMNDFHGASEILKKRLKISIEEAGFIFEKHIIFVPQQSRKGFSTLMKNADILLDTIGFSGMNTAMQAIGCGLPIITREGQFQRTKHVSAILKTIEAEELIAQTEEEYIDLVEKFFFDQEFQNAIKLKIKNKENYLYRNKSAIRELEDFFMNVGGY